MPFQNECENVRAAFLAPDIKAGARSAWLGRKGLGSHLERQVIREAPVMYKRAVTTDHMVVMLPSNQGLKLSRDIANH